MFWIVMNNYQTLFQIPENSGANSITGNLLIKKAVELLSDIMSYANFLKAKNDAYRKLNIDITSSIFERSKVFNLVLRLMN